MQGDCVYSSYRATLHEEIGQRSQAVQDQIAELSTFGKMVKLESFEPFK